MRNRRALREQIWSYVTIFRKRDPTCAVERTVVRELLKWEYWSSKEMFLDCDKQEMTVKRNVFELYLSSLFI